MSVSRNTLREIILQILYIYFIKKEKGSLEEIKSDVLNKYNLIINDTSFIDDYIKGIVDTHKDIENKIHKVTTKSDLEIMSLTDKCILLLSIYEIENAFIFDIPPAVSVFEAVNLAKKFSKDSSPAFINAVLRNYLNKYHNSINNDTK